MIDAIFENKNSTIAKDLKLNLNRFLTEGALPIEERWLAVLATSTSVGAKDLAVAARVELERLDFTSEQIQEAAESAAIMAMLNTYYRFKHFVGKVDDYRIAGLRMTALAKPQLGKTRFEMLAFAVSVLNGCETCVKAHEHVLREAGVSVDQIHDLARVAAVVKATSFL